MQNSSLLLAGALLLLGQAGLRAEPPLDTDKINKKIEPFTLTSADGKEFTLAGVKDKKAVVVVFLSFECPVSASYSALLAELAGKYGKDVAFVGINASDEGTPAEIARQASEYKLPFPVLKDPKLHAALAFKAKVVPEAFVLDHNLVLRYRGRIDNTWAARLKRYPRTTSHDLRQALDDLLAGKPVATPTTRAVGCSIPHAEADNATTRVTYYKDVLPILRENCQSCHRPGEVGPFSLMTLKQAVTWAADIKDYTHERRMPPWKPVEGVPFRNERRLSQKDIDTLAAWVDGGKPAGDPKDAPPEKVFTDGWQLGKPDLVLTVPEEMTVGPSGPDLFRCFVIPSGLTEDQFVVAWEVRPGNKRIVHHTLNFFDLTGKGRELEQKEKARPKKPDEQDIGPGYSVGMGIGFLPQQDKVGGLAGWAPGQLARGLPEGYGYPLPKGSDILLQVHYHRNGRVEKDRTQLGLYFAKKPGVKPFKSMVIPGVITLIPAGKERHRVTGSIEVQQDCELHTVMPHMHLLGKEIKVTMTTPTGETKTLVTIKDWDYNWQETYYLQEKIPVKKGTKFEVEAIYDNSAKNPNNPFSPPRWITYGEQTDNEMCFVFLGATADTPGRLRFLPKGFPRRSDLDLDLPKPEKTEKKP
jgi:thiol-disulfide isomerase/thioredoxin